MPEDVLNFNPDRILNVLVVEDNFINRTLLGKIFQKIGCTTTIVNDGPQAMAAFENSFYDLVFMDIELPGMDGFEVTKLLRNKYKDQPKQPIIVALTANSLSGERERCLDMGMNDYLAKPFSAEDVVNLVAKYGKQQVS